MAVFFSRRAVFFSQQARRTAVIVVAGLLIVTACTNGGDQGSDSTQGSSSTTSAEPAADAAGQDNDGTDSAPQVDDDIPQPAVVEHEGGSGYSNQALGYVGNPIWAQSVGNVPVSVENEVAIRFVARADGITSGAAFIIKYDFGRPNYHGGTCGQLQASLQRDRDGDPSGEVLTAMTFTNPCGGARDIGWLADGTWDAPAAVAGGETYHLVFTNLDPDPDNFVSVNMLYRPSDDATPLAVSTGDDALTLQSRGSAFWSGNDAGDWGAAEVLADHHPVFELVYDDGQRQGVSYVGLRFGSEIVLSPDDTTHVRQGFRLDQARTLTSMWFRDVESSDDAVLTATLRRHSIADDSASDQRGAIDDPATTAVIWSQTLTRAPGDAWYQADFDVPLEVRADVIYTVELEAVSGSVTVRPMYQAAHDDWLSTDQSDWADTFLETGSEATWDGYVNQIPHDLSLYFTTADNPGLDAGTTAAAVTRTSEITTVAVYGDSLIGEATFDNQLAAALEARGIAVVGKDNDPGRDVDGLVEALENNVLDADVYLLNIGINGGQSQQEFAVQARRSVDLIRATNSEAIVLWSSVHALPEAPEFVVERISPHNAVIAELAAEGLVVEVPWFDVAADNPQIYNSDGIHYFGNEQLYVQTMISGLDNWLATRS